MIHHALVPLTFISRCFRPLLTSITLLLLIIMIKCVIAEVFFKILLSSAASHSGGLSLKARADLHIKILLWLFLPSKIFATKRKCLSNVWQVFFTSVTNEAFSLDVVFDFHDSFTDCDQSIHTDSSEADGFNKDRTITTHSFSCSDSDLSLWRQVLTLKASTNFEGKY